MHEGSVSKLSAEVISGVYFPNPVWMQYTTYCLLRDMWKKRKKDLKNQITIGLGAKQKFDVENAHEDSTDENALKVAERKRLQREELARQKSLCSIMEKEEMYEFLLFYCIHETHLIVFFSSPSLFLSRSLP